MPCNSDYLEQNDYEIEMQKAAQFCLFVGERLEVPIPKMIVKEADTYYASDRGQVELLCALLSNMTKEQEDRIVYDGRNPESRRLADWWEEHQEADRIRLQEEREREETLRREQEIYEQAIAKLSDEEIDILKGKFSAE